MKLWITPLMLFFTSLAWGSVRSHELNTFIQGLEKEYAGQLQSLGYTLEFQMGVKEAEAPCYADSDFLNPSQKKIIVTRAWLKDRRLTLDHMKFFLCHELGHHLGGTPYKNKPSRKNLVSGEGQADYWGAQDCLLKALKKEDLTAQYDLETRPEITARCQAQFAEPLEIKACARAMEVSESSIQFLFHNEQKKEQAVSMFARNLPIPTLEQSESGRVTETELLYTSLQCRLDTLVAGILQQPRPGCWFYSIIE